MEERKLIILYGVYSSIFTFLQLYEQGDVSHAMREYKFNGGVFFFADRTMLKIKFHSILFQTRTSSDIVSKLGLTTCSGEGLVASLTS